jgi:hypothetical protein
MSYLLDQRNKYMSKSSNLSDALQEKLDQDYYESNKDKPRVNTKSPETMEKYNLRE